jgi:hypothetical protein
VPKPLKAEKLGKFVSRYVSSSEAERSFPKKRQRLAVAYSLYKQQKGKR